MKIAIMQPYLFPYIGYFQLINAVDKFIILDDVNYINRGWINRNRILINGKAHLFTLPLRKASQNKLINQIHVYFHNDWINKFLKTLEFAYKKAPYFRDVFSAILESLNEQESDILSKYILNTIRVIMHYLGLTTYIKTTSTVYQNNHLKSQSRLIDICIREGAKEYLNPIGGLKLYDKETFKKNNITLFFLKSKDIVYRQYDNEFVPNLSIIDVMMFNSVEEIKLMLNQYELF